MASLTPVTDYKVHSLRSQTKNQRLVRRCKRLAVENHKLRTMISHFGQIIVEDGIAERAKLRYADKYGTPAALAFWA